MAQLKEQLVSKMDVPVISGDSDIANFFNGKSVFITGAAGFVGGVLLESLLRCCPGIKYVYILMREKKGISPEKRKEQLLNKKIFGPLRSCNSEVFQKIKVVEGDISHPGMGISNDEVENLVTDVSVVFHCAAVISFMKPLRYMLEQNLKGAQNVLSLSRKFSNLEAFVHTSTAYVNCNQSCGDEIQESVYRLEVSANEFLDALNSNAPDAVLEDMQKKCLPAWPNTYTFTKALVEDLMVDTGLPVAIVRPSIIISSWKGVLPGYTEEGAGVIDVSVAIGKGFVRVMFCDENKMIDIIPVDVVTNALISASWAIATKKFEAPLVVSCTSGATSPCTWGHFIGSLFQMQKIYPLPKMYQKPSLVMRKYNVTYWASALVNHYAPAVLLDFVFILLKKKPRLTKLYKFYDVALYYLKYFMTNEWRFKCDNFLALSQIQTAEDAKLFPIDLTKFSIVELCKNIKNGSPFYEWANDKRKLDERLPLAHRRAFITNFIKWMVIIWFCFFVFFIFTKSFSRTGMLF